MLGANDLNVALRIKAYTKQAEREISAFGKTVKVNLNQIANAGRVITAGSAAIAGGFAMAVREGAAFQATMKDVEIQSGATAQQMKAMADTAVSQTFVDLGKSGTQVASMLKRLAAEGYSVAQMQTMLKPITEATIALGTGEEETTKLMLNLMEQFRMGAGDMGHISDVLASALANTSFQGQELAETLKMAGVAANMVGWSLEDTIAVTDRIIKVTGEASMAGRYFRASLSELSAPSKQLVTEFGRVGISAKEIADSLKDPRLAIDLLTKAQQRGINFMAAFSTVGAVGAGAMTGYTKEVDKTSKSLGKIGAAHDAATGKMSTLQGQTEQLRANLSNMGNTIAQAVMPALSDMLQDVQPLVKHVGDLAKSPVGQTMTKFAAGLATAGMVVGPMLMTLPKLADGWSLVSEWIKDAAANSWTLTRAFGKLGQYKGQLIGLAGAAAFIAVAFWDAERRASEFNDALDKLGGLEKLVGAEPGTAKSKYAQNIDAVSRDIAQLEEEAKSLQTVLNETIPDIGKGGTFAEMPGFDITDPLGMKRAKRLEAIGGIAGRGQVKEDLRSIRSRLLNLREARKTLVGEMNSLGTDAGKATVSGFARGIDKAGTYPVEQSMQKVAGSADKYLPHSDAKAGPLAHITASGKSIPETLAQGIRANAPALEAALHDMTKKALVELSKSSMWSDATDDMLAAWNKAWDDKKGTGKQYERYSAGADQTSSIDAAKELAAKVQAERKAMLNRLRAKYAPDYKGDLTKLPQLLYEREQMRNLAPGEQRTRYAGKNWQITHPTPSTMSVPAYSATQWPAMGGGGNETHVYVHLADDAETARVLAKSPDLRRTMEQVIVDAASVPLPRYSH